MRVMLSLYYSFLDTSNVFTDVDAGDSCACYVGCSWNIVRWCKLSNAGTPINANVGCQHTIQVTCEDDSGLCGLEDTYVLTITNTNDAPTASAGSDQTPTEGATVTLDASGPVMTTEIQ